MTVLSQLMAGSIALYSIVAVLETISVLITCLILTNTIFGLTAKIKPVTVIISAVLAVGYGVLRAFSETGRLGDNGIYVDLGVLLPFVVMTMFFFGKKVWKSYIAAFAVSLTSAVKYLVLMSMPDYDFVNPDLPLELLIEAGVDVFTCVILSAVFLLYVRKYRKAGSDLSRHLPLLIVLVVITAVLFVSSIVITGTNFTPERRQAYLFTLLCFPAFVVTAVYATHSVVKSAVQEHSYRRILDMQLKHFKMLDEKNEELRMFRHDFPKQMGPLLMYIKDGNTAEAEKIVSNFNVSVQGTRPRFNTGNCQLDTVLECEQQLASRKGITIRVLEGSTFPAEGIRSEDIYTIFPNALDNAIEACADLESEDVISFESHRNGNMLFVRITNPYDGSLQIDANGLKTKKKDKENHGFGIKSMQKAMSHYGSDNLFYETKNGRITLNLVFEL